MDLDLTSSFAGITTPTNELHAQIERYGWEVTKLTWDPKVNAFKAEGRDASGQTTAKTGPNDKTALANLLLAIARRTHLRTSAQYKLGMWQTMFTGQLKDIAEAYAKAPVYDPKAAVYFKELADDSTRRAHVLGQQLHIEVVDNPEPYPNAQAMADDIHKNKHFLVSRANSDHPIWSVEQNVAFRIVHDVLGHAVSGGDFGWQGENLACAAHFPLLTPTAQLALFTECIAQTGYAAYYRSFGPQKIAIFPEFVEGPQANENPAAHRGVHPSQSVAPEAMPQIPPSPPADTPHEKGYVAPHMQPQGLTPLVSHHEAKLAAGVLIDPNQGYKTGIAPLDPAQDIHPVSGQPVGNAYLHHGDPIESDKVMDTAALIDTRWHELPERPMQKQAIVNAFRVVLLSPRKDLRWNAIHYQHIANIPGDTKDPLVYWNTLNNHRQEWNMDQVRKHYEPDVKAGKMTKEAVEHLAEQARHSHEAWRQMWPKFFAIVLQQQGNHQKAQRWAEDMIYRWTSDEQIRIEMEDRQKPADKQMDIDEIERKSQAAMVKRMKLWIDDNKPKMDSFFAHRGNKDDETNYITELAIDIMNECSEQEIPDGYSHEQIMDLFREYALLALTKGKDTTPEDVHDAWSAWMATHDPDHDSLIPFDKLTPEVQAYDEPYCKAIHKHANSLFDMEPEQTVREQRPKIVRYGAFMGTHLKAISQISKHADTILDAAIEDVHKHDGTGHHFRAAVLQLNVSGVGPKVCSFAWLLLQPLTSQLATIDTHICDVLGHKFEKDLNNRDYFRFERELQAGRDAAGYSHIPLGAFQWGMWDYKRTGEGSHQDHSAMKVLDPTPHHMIDWAKHAGSRLKAERWHEQGPDWWKNTQPARDAVRAHWDNNIAPNTPVGEIPYQITDDTMLRAASTCRRSGESKHEFHVAFTLPEELFAKLDTIASELGIRKEKPENYHITGFSAETGFDRQELHRWIRNNSVSGLRFTNARLEFFPSKVEKEKYAVVLQFDAPEAKELMTRLMDEGEKDYDLNITRFDGGWKGHITLGWSDEQTTRTKYPEIEFRTGPLYISIPRPLRRKQEDPIYQTRKTGTKMRQYRMETGLSTPDIWKLHPDPEEDDPVANPQGDIDSAIDHRSPGSDQGSGFESVPNTASEAR